MDLSGVVADDLDLDLEIRADDEPVSAWVVGVIGYALLLLMGLLWRLPDIEADIETRSLSALDERGHRGFVVDVDGRIVTVEAVQLTSADDSNTAVEDQEIESIVEAVDGVRWATVRRSSVLAAPTTSDAPLSSTTSTTSTTTPAVATSSTTTTVQVDAAGTEASSLSLTRDADDHVVLAGRVATTEQRDELFEAANSGGFSRLSDRIDVDDETDPDDERHRALVDVVAVVAAEVMPASLMLEDDRLVLDGETGLPDAPARIDAALDGVRELGIDAEMTVEAISEDEQVVRLRDELEQVLALAARIEPERSQFGPESSEVDIKGEVVLDRVGQAIRRYPLPAVAIVGHTDDIGPADENLELSIARAQAVVDYLVQEQGVEESRLVATGRGEQAPTASNATDEGRRQNRRVQFVVSMRPS